MKTYNISYSDDVKPLLIPTPFIQGESLTSWILRASFNQGCDYSALIFYHWSEYKLLSNDFDRGFNHINPKIHEDIAVLMNSSKDFVDAQTLVSYNNQLGIDVQENNKLKWVLPYIKRNIKRMTGHPYCFHCFREGKDYLQQQWRYSWYVYCDKHHLLLSDTCPHCNIPYQPHSIKIPQHSFMECPHCHNDLRNALTNLLLKSDAFEFQIQAQQALNGGNAVIFGEEWSVGDWFELMLFYMNFIRTALATKEGSINRRILEALKLEDIRGVKLTKIKTGLAFDLLSIYDRLMLMSYANVLSKVDADTWVRVLNNCGATKATLKMGKNPIIPRAFLSIHDQLPDCKSRAPIQRSNSSDKRKLKPKSTKAVLVAWERLQIKINKVKTHEEIRNSRKSSI